MSNIKGLSELISDCARWGCPCGLCGKKTGSKTCIGCRADSYNRFVLDVTTLNLFGFYRESNNRLRDLDRVFELKDKQLEIDSLKDIINADRGR